MDQSNFREAGGIEIVNAREVVNSFLGKGEKTGWGFQKITVPFVDVCIYQVEQELPCHWFLGELALHHLHEVLIVVGCHV